MYSFFAALHARIRRLGTAARRVVLDERHALDLRPRAAVVHDDDLRRIAGRADRRDRLGAAAPADPSSAR